MSRKRPSPRRSVKPEEPSRLGPLQVVISFFVLFHLAFLLVDNAQIEPVFAGGDNPFSRYGRWTAQWQQWGMFTFVPVRVRGVRLESVADAERRPLDATWPDVRSGPQDLHGREENFFTGLASPRWVDFAVGYLDLAARESLARHGRTERIELGIESRSLRRLEEIRSDGNRHVESLDVLELGLWRVSRAGSARLPLLLPGDEAWRSKAASTLEGGRLNPQLLGILLRSAGSACADRDLPARLELRITRSVSHDGAASKPKGQAHVAGVLPCPG